MVLKKIQDSLHSAVQQESFQDVQKILNDSSDSDIQEVLKSKLSDNYTILDFAIFKKNAKIIEQIWQKANNKTRDFLCNSAILFVKHFPQKNDLAKVIQEVEVYKRVMDLDYELRKAIESLHVEKVKAVLEDCGEDANKVLKRLIHDSHEKTSNIFLFYPLSIHHGKRLDQDNVKNIEEITKLFWDKAFQDVRESWFEIYRVRSIDIINSLKDEQKQYANIAGEGWLCAVETREVLKLCSR